jgi:hypothetical protein
MLHRLSRVLVATLVATLPAVRPSAARAQDMGKGFLFGPPAGSITIRGGWALANARSDFFSFTTNELTLDRRDFSSPTGDIDLAIRLGPRTDIVASASLAGMSKTSEFRHYVDSLDQPIQQTTQFRRVPITIGVREYVLSPGRSIGRYAWIPSRFAPYVGAGVGGMYYRFQQQGNFVDMQSLAIFPSTYESAGWALTGYGRVGIDYSLNPWLALTTEARYLVGNTSLSSDFQGFGRLDLSGLSTTVGLTLRFF